MTMTKRELVMRVATKVDMTQNEVAAIIDGAFETIAQSLAQGERWELRDFGIFEVKPRGPREARNPRTGAKVSVPEKNVVTFRPGKRMKQRIDESGSVQNAAGAGGESGEAKDVPQM